jgi:hypothetical protein
MQKAMQNHDEFCETKQHISWKVKKMVVKTGKPHGLCQDWMTWSSWSRGTKTSAFNAALTQNLGRGWLGSY